jgi:hypothetical protein
LACSLAGKRREGEQARRINRARTRQRRRRTGRYLLPGKPGDVGGATLLERFEDWKNTHGRFSRGAKTGVWERVFQHLATDANNEYAMIDSTIVRRPGRACRRADGQGRLRTAGDLIVPENLSLAFLPPYSPELNPIERLWLHLRDNRLSHRVFPARPDHRVLGCEAWNWLLAETGRIQSVLLPLAAPGKLLIRSVITRKSAARNPTDC